VDREFLYLRHHAPIKLNDITKIKYINRELRNLMLFLSVIFVLIIYSGVFLLNLFLSLGSQGQTDKEKNVSDLIGGLSLLLLPASFIAVYYFFPYHKIIINQGWALSPLIQP